MEMEGKTEGVCTTKRLRPGGLHEPPPPPPSPSPPSPPPPPPPSPPAQLCNKCRVTSHENGRGCEAFREYNPKG
ncbi:hypothetical protein HZH68_012896 [Vespula germanica]|uniref:Uncharacterized protein n=1 Tax=Vespula germanica TaxID=30212 RepID=A0A834JF28_VESGE|nr:hypothetical protein HZH68_012896 [Vespula germanica]